MMYAIWSSLSLRWCLARAAATSDTGPRPHSSMQYHTCRPTLDTGPGSYMLMINFLPPKKETALHLHARMHGIVLSFSF